MLPVSAFVDVMAALYAPPSGYFETIQTTGGIYWGIRRESGVLIICCRGSDDLHDWWVDGLSEGSRAVPGYPSLGLVPYGFGEGLLSTYKAIGGALASGWPVYFIGHSLGAAHAAELAGMLIADGDKPAGIVLCGCPKPGMIHLSTLVQSSGVPVVSLRNGKDPVPTVPVPLSPLLEWRDYVPFTLTDEAPGPLTTLSTFDRLIPDAAWHSIALYQAAARKLTATL